MKISDIKGNIASEINNKLLKKYNRILTEFNATIDQNIYSPIPLVSEIRGFLFRYNKDMKDFLSTGTGTFYLRWWNKSSQTTKEYFKFNGSKTTSTEYFKFDDSVFSTRLEIISFTSISIVEHNGRLTINIKDPANFLSDLFNSLNNIIPKFSKPKDFRGIEIRVGDIVVYSDCNYAQVRLGEVTKLNDVLVTINSQERLINKSPDDLIVVSRELITKI